MDCVNHSGVNATAYCQSCGKALCAGCVRNAAGGQVLCEPCWTAWHGYQQPFVSPYPGGPNPAVAAVLGLIPGVGAMYNGQFVKGLIHVAIFAVLVSAAHLYGVFGVLIAGWIFYQAFEAYHTAKARRDGLPLPDPLGLNELAASLNPGARGPYPGAPGAGPENPAPASHGAGGPGPAAGYPTPNQPPGYQAPYQGPYAPPPGVGDPGWQPIPPVPPVPPVPPRGWRRREPIGAIVLIALGVMFLLGQMDLFTNRMFESSWPLLLIVLGVWMIFRRVGDSQGRSK